MADDEMIIYHHKLNGHEFEQTLGDSEGQGNLACCSPWGLKELDTTQQLNNNNAVTKPMHNPTVIGQKRAILCNQATQMKLSEILKFLLK